MKKIIAILLVHIMMLMTFASASEIDLKGIGKSLLEQVGFTRQSDEDVTEEETESDSDADIGSIGSSLIGSLGSVMESVLDTSGEEPSDESAWENILLMGCDARSDSMRTRTDTMIILSINSAEGRVKMTSLMRDTWMEVSGKEGHHKLTEFNVWGGPEMTIRAINENFDMEIEKFALVNMKGFAQVIDILGGVDIEITEAERRHINDRLQDYHFNGADMSAVKESSLVHLNGSQALAYARIRYLDSDYVRTERQRKVLVAIAENIRDGFDMKSILEMIGVLGDLVETNLSMADLIRLASMAMKIDLDSLEQYRVPVDGTFKSGMFGNTWCIKPDFAENAELLHEFIYGE